VLQSIRWAIFCVGFLAIASCLAVAQTPSISSLSPNPLGIGQSVTIQGTNFGSTGSVTFSGTAAATTFWSASKIIAMVPPGTVGGNLVVTVGGLSSSGFPFALNNGPVSYVYDDLGRLVGVIDVKGNAAEYAYDAVGNITSISRFTATQVSIINFAPESGPVGTSVTINGTGFSSTASQNAVKFNGTTATVASATISQIQAIVPASATTGPISVTSPNGPANSPTSFTVTNSNGTPSITSFSPTTGLGTTVVNLVGTNFDLVSANDKLRLNASVASVTGATATTLATTVPAATASGHFSVLTAAGKGVSSQDFYVPFGSHVAGDIGFTARIASGGSQTVTLGTPSKIGMVLFDGTAGQYVSIGISGSTFASCTLSLIGPSNATVASTGCTSSASSLGSTRLPITGTYTIGVDPGISTGSVLLSLSSDILLSILPGGPPVAVATTQPSQNVRLTFDASANQHVSMNFTNSTYSNCSIYLWDSYGANVAADTCTTTHFGDIPVLATTGVYTFIVSSTNASGGVTLKLNDSSDVTSSIVIDGAGVVATTTVPGQDARLNFTATAGKRIVVYASNVSNPAASVFIVNPDGTAQNGQLSINNNSPGQVFFLDTRTLTAAGNYQLWVKHSGAGIGSETLQISSVPADFTGTVAVPAAGSTGAAKRVPTSGNLAAGQNGNLTFTGAVGQKLSFNVISPMFGASPSDCNLNVFDPNGVVSVGFGFCGTGASNYVDTVNVALAGTYQIVVDPQGAATGSVSVSINNDADVTGSITIDGATVTKATALAGRDIRLSFTGTAGKKIVVYATSVTNPAANVAIVNPDLTTQSGQLSINNNPAGQTFFLDTHTLVTAGTYQLWVQHIRSGFGSVTLQIVSVPADVAKTATVGGAAVVFSTVTGQNANVSVSNPASQSLTVHWTADTYPTGQNCYVFVSGPSPSTTLVGSGSCNSATGSISLGTLASGNYTILVDPQLQSTGGMSMTVTTP
jgi:YD repeat-containing protein